MQSIVVRGGRKLSGEVIIDGAKNSALPLIAATLLAEKGCSRLDNVPDLRDINTIVRLLEGMGAVVSRQGGSLEITTSAVENCQAPYELVKTMRASILVLGPLMARFGEARVSLPGGCAIGARPVNLHIKGLEMMGARISVEHGYIIGQAERLQGADISFDVTTVTGTENLMMAAVLADGVTILRNAAREPEIVDLAAFLRKMGAQIEGDGTHTITITGVEKLLAADYQVMPDRIEAGTFMVAAGISDGDVVIKNAPLAAMAAVVTKLQEIGLLIEPLSPEEDDDELYKENKLLAGVAVRVRRGLDGLKALDVRTMPYPGFPTDMQSQAMVLLTLAEGTSVISETIFENRFMHVFELQRMGADIEVEGRTAIVRGVVALSGAPVMASDLRASAGLVLAGLAAEGETVMSRVYHLDRGYAGFEKKLKALGADVKRVRD
ncbi:MAG: UDP-N-acetylglucosamine 1-carboxyvinyltransferase [Deltaproteobacteria bacterium]|nr:UDP-N-acetylglucosamine 1-carboxyvinyltransferase [Candidatus Tharpella aukensis]